MGERVAMRIRVLHWLMLGVIGIAHLAHSRDISLPSISRGHFRFIALCGGANGNDDNRSRGRKVTLLNATIPIHLTDRHHQKI